MRNPDRVGIAGSMWKMRLPTREENLVASQTTLGSWLLHIPAAHPWWYHYLLSVVHLRDIPDVPPANKHYPEAEYEIMLFALDPERIIPDPDNPYPFRGTLLDPANLVEQFHGVTDDQAIRITELLAFSFVDGICNPDTDFRRHTQKTLKHTIDHFVTGHERG